MKPLDEVPLQINVAFPGVSQMLALNMPVERPIYEKDTSHIFVARRDLRGSTHDF